MQSHGPLSAAVLFALAWTSLAVVNNVRVKRQLSIINVELSSFCWGQYLPCMRLAAATALPVLTDVNILSAVRVVAFICEAVAAHHPSRIKNAIFEELSDGSFFVLMLLLYGAFRVWYVNADLETL